MVQQPSSLWLTKEAHPGGRGEPPLTSPLWPRCSPSTPHSSAGTASRVGALIPQVSAMRSLPTGHLKLVSWVQGTKEKGLACQRLKLMTRPPHDRVPVPIPPGAQRGQVLREQRLGVGLPVSAETTCPGK